MELFKLFPTDVYIEKNTEIDNKKISEVILKKEKVESSRELTNRDGWQSKDNLHRDKNFSEILETLVKSFQSICNNYGYRNQLEWYVTNMWANVNRYRDYNSSHTHCGSDWSFVYYVKSPKDSGNLIFCEPRIRKELLPDNTFKNFDNLFTDGKKPEDAKRSIVINFLDKFFGMKWNNHHLLHHNKNKVYNRLYYY